MNAYIDAVHPVLMSRDVVASIQFFQHLGFRELFRDSPTDTRYAGVSRDGVEIHLQWHAPEQWRHNADLPTYRFLVSDVDQLYAELLESGALPSATGRQSPWAAPGNTPWGTREFHFRDPDGNGLQFYQAASSSG
jgi:catechol 2,3-dioxygenase-like lactoylglutathione lyase family enzyme